MEEFHFDCGFEFLWNMWIFEIERERVKERPYLFSFNYVQGVLYTRWRPPQ